jgi:hypothetical protein
VEISPLEPTSGGWFHSYMSSVHPTCDDILFDSYLPGGFNDSKTQQPIAFANHECWGELAIDCT